MFDTIQLLLFCEEIQTVNFLKRKLFFQVSGYLDTEEPFECVSYHRFSCIIMYSISGFKVNVFDLFRGSKYREKFISDASLHLMQFYQLQINFFTLALSRFERLECNGVRGIFSSNACKNGQILTSDGDKSTVEIPFSGFR